MAYENSFVALADPTRRAVFELIATQPRSVAEITRSLPVSQSAVSQHLKILKGANLVLMEAQGTRNIYRVDLMGIMRMREWLDNMWSDALAAFAEEFNTLEINNPAEKMNGT
jgi:DNA-binding transcriptional ArsR family regulator